MYRIAKQHSPYKPSKDESRAETGWDAAEIITIQNKLHSW